MPESIERAVRECPRLIEYSQYAMQLLPFRDAFGAANILPAFFERLIAEPQVELERVCRFIGYQGTPRWREDDGESNVSAKRMRKSGLRDALVWNPVSTWIRRRMIPQGWRDRAKRLWQMRERPKLSEATLADLRATFDEDLRVLGGWLGVELNCANFKTVAKAGPHDFRQRLAACVASSPRGRRNGRNAFDGTTSATGGRRYIGAGATSAPTPFWRSTRQMTETRHDNIGLVAIGRNEGERLERCLRSVVERVATVVYVDSGSTDGSVAFARSLGVEVVELDLSIPFTAARARNAGLERLLALSPDLGFVQFVDGDCEVVDGWLEDALKALQEREDLAIACGRRRERFPEASVYNRLCDLEWDTPVGEARACGGDALMRVAALRQVDGFNGTLIAGEEPEMCFRLREKGWKILRIDAEMTLHDAAVTRFGQWWRRAVRGGACVCRGRMAARSQQKSVTTSSRWSRRLCGAGCCWAIALVLAWWARGLSLVVVMLLYAFQWWRIARNERRRGRSPQDAGWNAWFIVSSKFAQLRGIWMFVWRRLTRRRSEIIEYKRAAVAPTGCNGAAREK